MKFGQAVSGEKMFHYYGNIHVYIQGRRCFIIMEIYMYIAPGQGQTTYQGLKFHIININLLSICLFLVSFTH